MIDRRSVLAIAVAFASATAARAAGPHRLVLQISDSDERKMRATLDIAANVSRHYSATGGEVEIVVIGFNGGADMMLDDRSPVKDRLKNFIGSMPNVAFRACGNTLDALTAREGRRPPLIEGVEIAPVGVAAIMELAEQGWTVVRP